MVRNCGGAAGVNPDVGICHHGSQMCVTGAWAACSGNQDPLARQCGSSADNNCNGIADNGEANCQCWPTGTSACNTHAQDGTGACQAGSHTCNLTTDGSGNQSTSFTTCSGSVGPTFGWNTSPIPGHGCSGSDHTSINCWDYSCSNVVDMFYSYVDSGDVPATCIGNGSNLDTWCNAHASTPAACAALNGNSALPPGDPYGNYARRIYFDPALTGCGTQLCLVRCFWGSFCQGWGESTPQGCH
jgi:hypothetical protein